MFFQRNIRTKNFAANRTIIIIRRIHFCIDFGFIVDNRRSATDRMKKFFWILRNIIVVVIFRFDIHLKKRLFYFGLHKIIVFLQIRLTDSKIFFNFSLFVIMSFFEGRPRFLGALCEKFICDINWSSRLNFKPHTIQEIAWSNSFLSMLSSFTEEWATALWRVRYDIFVNFLKHISHCIQPAKLQIEY